MTKLEEDKEFNRNGIIYSLVALVLVILIFLYMRFEPIAHKKRAHDVPSEPTQEVLEEHHLASS